MPQIVDNPFMRAIANLRSQLGYKPYGEIDPALLSLAKRAEQAGAYANAAGIMQDQGYNVQAKGGVLGGALSWYNPFIGQDLSKSGSNIITQSVMSPSGEPIVNQNYDYSNTLPEVADLTGSSESGSLSKIRTLKNQFKPLSKKGNQ